MATIGIRREEKSVWERRAPLVPEDVRHLLQDEGIRLTVQPSPRRVFADEEFREAGATISENLSRCDVILGIKEVPATSIHRDKTFMFFSHVIKGQPHNMPMLRLLLERGCTLFDHELVTNDEGKRLIAFGRFAGLAGAIDSLWVLGRRLEREGFATPLTHLKQSMDYVDLGEARGAVRRVGEEIRAHGLPEGLRPLVVGLTGHGNVGAGVREIMDLLPIVEARPGDLVRASALAGPEGRNIVFVQWDTHDLVEPKSPGSSFSRGEYREHPDRYRSRFAASLRHITLFLHGIQWSVGSPRFVTREDLRGLARDPAARLRVIGDISCDVNGSLDSTVRTTDPGTPAYVYNPDTGEATDGIDGRGVVVVPVEIFPAEFPKDASLHFSSALAPMIGPLARMNPALGPEDPMIPPALRRSAIAVRGRLLPAWDEKLRDPLARYGRDGHGGPETATS